MYSYKKEGIRSAVRHHVDVVATATAARAEHAEIVAALRDAREAVASWGAYADDHYKEKWNLAGDIARLDAIIARVGGGA